MPQAVDMAGVRRQLFPLGLASLLAIELASLPATARAHDPPHGTLLVWESESSDATPLIVSNRGLVFADEVDGATRFSLRCARAYGANSSDRAPVFLEASGRLTIGMYSGVLGTSDRVCSTQAGTGLPAGESLGTVASIAAAPERLLVSTRTFTGVSGVFKSMDGGRSFSESFRNPADQYYERLIPAPSDPLRVYAGGQRADRVNRQVIFLCSISRDGGTTWMDQVVPAKLTPFAVHPSDPDVVFAYQPVDSLETEYRVLRSEDRGANFSAVLENVRKPTALAGSGPGVLWLGIGDAGGLFRSGDEGRTFEQVHEGSLQSVTCLIQRRGRLWVCGNMAPNSNGVWYSDDGGETLEKLLTFEDVTHAVMCDDLEAQVLCGPDWYDFDRELHPPSPDGGVGAEPAVEEAGAGQGPQTTDDDAGVPGDSDSGGVPRAKRASGCQAQPSAARGGAWAVALALGGLLVARRRRAAPARREGLRGERRGWGACPAQTHDTARA